MLRVTVGSKLDCLTSPTHLGGLLACSVHKNRAYSQTFLQAQRKMATVSSSSNQPLTHLLILDFEATCLKFKSRDFKSEIVEFPVLVFDMNTMAVTDIFHEYVKPVLNPKLSDFCTELTGIKQETVDSASTFMPVWQRFLHFLDSHGFTEANKSSFAFLTCGDWDLRTMLPLQASLSRNSDAPIHVDSRFQRWLNLKRQIPAFYPERRGNQGMASILYSFGLVLEGRHHSGIDDCKNISRIVACMCKDGWQPTLDPPTLSTS